MLVSTIPLRALKYAIEAHGEINQRRKYTNELYITHPFRVGMIVKEVGGSEAMIAAAFLHDVVEDTPRTLQEIRYNFGMEIAEMVNDLTKVGMPEHGNRAVRKEMDRLHTAKARQESKTIKLADLIHNAESIIEYDPGFAVKWMKEKADLLKVLTEGDPILYKQAQDIVDAYYKDK